MYPHLNDGVVGAVHLPADGQADPDNIALALAKGARNGALIKEGVRVTASMGRWSVTGVQWASDTSDEIGTIDADVVMLWWHVAREVGAMAGVNVPHACEHFYLVTEPVDGLTQLPCYAFQTNMPITRKTPVK